MKTKFQVINWSQDSRVSERFPLCDSLKDAMDYCKHQTPYGADAQEWEEYSEIIELDHQGISVNTYYFVTYNEN